MIATTADHEFTTTLCLVLSSLLCVASHAANSIANTPVAGGVGAPLVAHRRTSPRSGECGSGAHVKPYPADGDGKSDKRTESDEERIRLAVTPANHRTTITLAARGKSGELASYPCV